MSDKVCLSMPPSHNSQTKPSCRSIANHSQVSILTEEARPNAFERMQLFQPVALSTSVGVLSCDREAHDNNIGVENNSGLLKPSPRKMMHAGGVPDQGGHTLSSQSSPARGADDNSSYSHAESEASSTSESVAESFSPPSDSESDYLPGSEESSALKRSEKDTVYSPRHSHGDGKTTTKQASPLHEQPDEAKISRELFGASASTSSPASMPPAAEDVTALPHANAASKTSARSGIDLTGFPPRPAAPRQETSPPRDALQYNPAGSVSPNVPAFSFPMPPYGIYPVAHLPSAAYSPNAGASQWQPQFPRSPPGQMASFGFFPAYHASVLYAPNTWASQQWHHYFQYGSPSTSPQHSPHRNYPCIQNVASLPPTAHAPPAPPQFASPSYIQPPTTGILNRALTPLVTPRAERRQEGQPWPTRHPLETPPSRKRVCRSSPLAREGFTLRTPNASLLGTSVASSIPGLSPQSRKKTRRSSRPSREPKRLADARPTTPERRRRKKKIPKYPMPSRVYALAYSHDDDWSTYGGIARTDDKTMPLVKTSCESTKPRSQRVVLDVDRSPGGACFSPLEPLSVYRENEESRRAHEGNELSRKDSRVLNVEKSSELRHTALKPLGTSWREEAEREWEALEKKHKRNNGNIDVLANWFSLLQDHWGLLTSPTRRSGMDADEVLILESLEDEMQLEVPAFITGDLETIERVQAERTIFASSSPRLDSESDAWARKKFALPTPGVLLETEIELAWLAEESIYCLECPSWDWSYIWIHASPALKSVISSQNPILVRPAVRESFRQARASIQRALQGGYRRPHMDQVIRRHFELLREQQQQYHAKNETTQRQAVSPSD